ncbi:cytochrome c oxidase subunit 2 [Novosphingobium chloroacetimidivorans]|uniref:Cytochrome c oxidase subunit 2 n=1 Tax=Novosphingobium chloroacetimidivorans TaxID=1428314 RepID=A0A7W7NVR1_9SPHN|nr:cytochrome c oxidase subunit II [Novosphingobium chloroacetimidivorans]MBB4857360.1 cytochrome c oxidase subunit 2 [Novosphingobium chloroacetimidivorans]
MKSGHQVRPTSLKISHLGKALGLSLALAMLPSAALAAAPTPLPAYSTPAAGAPGAQAPVAADKGAASAEVAGNPVNNEGPTKDAAALPGYTPMKPTPGIGMPVDGGIGLQKQFSPFGEYGHWIHDVVLMPLVAAMTILVLVLLVWVAIRFNRRANPIASRTSHNTLLEVAWTLIPVLILVCIAVPSIDLIAKQYKPAPKTALTVKITGNQWFWTYSYPDNGEFEVNSYMLNLPGQPIINAGIREVGSKPWDGPSHMEVDNRMVVPAGEPIRLQITAADVIHSFAVPSLWFKLDAVPGRINEKVLFVEKPGVYYGQCSELCGVKHGYMPIAIEALPRAQYNAWVLAHAGGVIDGQKKLADTTTQAPAAAPAADASEAVPADNASEAVPSVETTASPAA